MDRYIVTKAEIEQMEGLDKQHYLNPQARRNNKSLGDLAGIAGFGFHLIEVPPGSESTEYHQHLFEDECTYILDGEAEVEIGEETHRLGAGDFIGYRAGGQAHTMRNCGTGTLCCIVVGDRLPHDVADYPRLGKRLYRNQGQPWDLVNIDNLSHPQGGQKS